MAQDVSKALQNLRTARLVAAERALLLLPGSYKIWKNHLEFRITLLNIDSSHRTNTPTSTHPKDSDSGYSFNWYQVASTHSHHQFHNLQSAFERALVRLNKMPRIWVLYTDVVCDMIPLVDITFVRNLFDQALLALPATQHEKIWSGYRKWCLRPSPTAITPTKQLEVHDPSDDEDDDTGLPWMHHAAARNQAKCQKTKERMQFHLVGIETQTITVVHLGQQQQTTT